MRQMFYMDVAEWDGRVIPGAKEPGIRIVLLMPTLEQARTVHSNLIQAELEGQWSFLGGKFNQNHHKVSFPGGSWIQIVTAENGDRGIRGIRCDFAALDEADDIDPELYDSVVQPWFSEPFSLKKVLIAGTPRRGRYGLLWRAHALWPKSEPNHYSFHATGYDAPLIVDPEYLESTRRKMAPEIFKREWLCDFDSAEGLVYSMFSEAFHIRPALPPKRYAEILVGADHGWEDPGVLLAVGVQGSGHEATAHVIEEVYKSGESDQWWRDQVQAWVRKYPNAKWYPDPSRPGAIDDWRRLGARIQEVDNSIADGVGAVADRLVIRSQGEHQHARLYVDPRCENTIREFGLYRRKRDPRNKERVLEDIQDRNNHAMDALRYAILNRFGGPERKRIEYGDTEFTYG